MEILNNIPLAPLTQLRVGGSARHFAVVENEKDIRDAISFAREKNLPLFILGGGSNILISDGGFSGLVLQMKNNQRLWSEDDTLVVADAGVSWDALVADATAHNRYGLENLSGIPGSVGGATIGNIGAYGREVGEMIEWALAIDTRTLNSVRFSRAACQFLYRESFFKHEEGKHFIVLCAAFRLQKGASLHKAYKDIALYEERQGEISTLPALRSAILAIRAKKFPEGGSIGTAGSFFKNPIVTKIVADEFIKRFPLAPHFPEADGRVKLSAAWIIDHVLGLRGVREGNVGTWPAQALVLVNYGEAKASEISRFADMIIVRAQKEAGITLVPEVVFVGD